MRLKEPLLRLPVCFDAGKLAAEVAALPPEAWVPHPNRLPGNAAVRLVTPRGEPSEDTAPPMAPTPYLLQSPYMLDVMAAIGGVWGRSRLMRLTPGAVVPPHIDTNYYWRTHVRVHVPITTTPDVLFTCAGQTVHMAAGECWIFDTFSSHHVRNGAQTRVHLVLDTVGGEGLWDLIAEARSRAASGEDALPRRIAADAGRRRDVAFEQADVASIMSPWELRYHVDFIVAQAAPGPGLETILARLDRFVAGWTGAWARYGSGTEGVPGYRRMISSLENDLLGMGGEKLRLRNGLFLYRQIAELVFAVGATLASATPVSGAPAARLAS